MTRQRYRINIKHLVICHVAALFIPFVITSAIYDNVIVPSLEKDFQEKVSQINFTVSRVSNAGVGGELFVSASIITPLIPDPLPFQVSQIRCNFVRLATCTDVQECYEIIRIHYPSTPFNRIGYIYWPELCGGITIGGSSPIYTPFPRLIVQLVIVTFNLCVIYIISRFNRCNPYLCPFLCEPITPHNQHEDNWPTFSNPIHSVRHYVQPTTSSTILRKHPAIFRDIPEGEEKECAITMEPIYGVYAHCVNCRHNFEFQSFVRWWNEQGTCPICRESLMIESTSPSVIIYTNQNSPQKESQSQSQTQSQTQTQDGHVANLISPSRLLFLTSHPHPHPHPTQYPPHTQRTTPLRLSPRQIGIPNHIPPG